MIDEGDLELIALYGSLKVAYHDLVEKADSLASKSTLYLAQQLVDVERFSRLFRPLPTTHQHRLFTPTELTQLTDACKNYLEEIGKMAYPQEE